MDVEKIGEKEKEEEKIKEKRRISTVWLQGENIKKENRIEIVGRSHDFFFLFKAGEKIGKKFSTSYYALHHRRSCNSKEADKDGEG